MATWDAIKVSVLMPVSGCWNRQDQCCSLARSFPPALQRSGSAATNPTAGDVGQAQQWQGWAGG